MELNACLIHLDVVYNSISTFANFSAMKAILFLASVLGFGVPITSVAIPKCHTDEDCNLNGVCNPFSKTCICDSGWRSSDCGELDVRPATRNSGYNQTGVGTSSWGSKIVHDPHNSKLFHLFLAEFTDGCGLDYWSPYSRIIHAESTSGPIGPYTFSNQVVGTFAHNPTVVYSPADKLYLLYYIGCSFSAPAVCTGPSFTCGPGNDLNAESGISVQSSPDLKTWTPHGQVFSGDNGTNWDADVTNPSPFPLYSPYNPTAEILLAYRGCPYNCGGAELINFAMAQRFKGPYTKIESQPIFQNGNEDPFVWQDKRGNFHLLLHSLEAGGAFGDGPKVGRHAFAREFEGPWTFNNQTLAFNTTVQYTDGTSVNFYRRERPQLFFSEDGRMTPLYLTTGVQEVNSPQSYSVIQPLGGAAAYEANLGF